METTWLWALSVEIAVALIVAGPVSLKGPVYNLDRAVGMEPSVV